MHRSIAALALLVSCAVASPSARAEEREATQAQLTKELDDYFDEIDLNKDARLTKLELSAFATRRRLGVFVRPDVWKMMDADRSNSLSRKEFSEGMLSIRAKRLAAEAAKQP